MAETTRQEVTSHPAELARFQAGKRGLLGFFLEELTKATEGQAEPERGRDRRLAALDGPGATPRDAGDEHRKTEDES